MLPNLFLYLNVIYFRAALERKAELYEHLSDSAGNSQLAGRFLVDFHSKKQQEPEKAVEEEPEVYQNDSSFSQDDDEW